MSSSKRGPQFSAPSSSSSSTLSSADRETKKAETHQLKRTHAVIGLMFQQPKKHNSTQETESSSLGSVCDMVDSNHLSGSDGSSNPSNKRQNISSEKNMAPLLTASQEVAAINEAAEKAIAFSLASSGATPYTLLSLKDFETPDDFDENASTPLILSPRYNIDYAATDGETSTTSADSSPVIRPIPSRTYRNGM